MDDGESRMDVPSTARGVFAIVETQVLVDLWPYWLHEASAAALHARECTSAARGVASRPRLGARDEG